MALESLSEKLQNIFKKLRGKGKLSESDVKEAMREIRMALLEADVNFKVVKSFISDIQARAVGSEVLESLTPGQNVIKIVDEELVKLLGSDTTSIDIVSDIPITVIMMVGLQGAGKTTTAAKLAGLFKSSGHNPLLVAGDIYRPAAIEQLCINASKVGVDVYKKDGALSVADIAKEAYEKALAEKKNPLIIDTAGRLQIDEQMMDELVSIKNALDVNYTILTVDAMTGQEAVNVAKSFDEKVAIDGVIVTKLDGDTRGGAVLSVKAVTGKPILYVGMGEKLSDLETFHPDRMASRILGMGDVLTLIEKAQKEVDEQEALRMAQKVRRAEFDYDDYLDAMNQMKKLGGISSILGMLPGISSKIKNVDAIDESGFDRIDAIIRSMTKEERANPNIINPSRRNRIARGAGVDISEVNKLTKNFEQMRKMMKQMPSMMKGKKSGFGGLGNMFGGMKFPGM